MKRRPPGHTGFEATVLGIGDLADRSVPMDQGVATLHRAMDYGLNLIEGQGPCWWNPGKGKGPLRLGLRIVEA
jgi:hypothetical protein